MPDLKLGYGLNTDIPDGVTAVWGARLIFPADLVWDRTDIAGPDADRTKLTEWLNGGVLRQALIVARTMTNAGYLRPDESRTFPLYEGTDGIVMADPQRSHGYLYVAAWLLPTR